MTAAELLIGANRIVWTRKGNKLTRVIKPGIRLQPITDAKRQTQNQQGTNNA